MGDAILKIDEVGKAYGIYISIDDEFQEEFKKTRPFNMPQIDVAVKHGDTVKEFTFADFFERLGFE